MAKLRILIIGGGGVGTMAAYALQTGGHADVTIVLRSNFAAVERDGFTIDSIQHGHDIKNWRPHRIVQSIPNATPEAPFDYILVATKNIPDVKPTVVDLISPALTRTHTSVLLLQNGLNIERPLQAAFPTNPILSAVSLIGATETHPGIVRHDDTDDCKVGPFPLPGDNSPPAAWQADARRLVQAYNACGRVSWTLDLDVKATRWRKLLYNSSFNSVAAVTGLDTARMRMSEFVVEELVLPVMREIKAVARAAGVELGEGVEERVVRVDPTDTAFVPSMGQDAAKVGSLLVCFRVASGWGLKYRFQFTD